jgi:hypothetical protein
MSSYEALNWLWLGNDREAEAVASEFPDERLNGHIVVFAALGRPGGRADAWRTIQKFASTGAPWPRRVEVSPLLFALDPTRSTSEVKELIQDAAGMSLRDLEERKR